MDRDLAALLTGLRTSRAAIALNSVVLLLAAVSVGVADSAIALGVGRPLTQSALGQPLNMVFPLRLAADESLASECVRVEVVAGDARIPANLLQIVLEGENEASVRAVRLQSAVQIDEPIVTVNLSMGCPARFTRQYTAFIDPPNLRASVSPPQSAVEPPFAEAASRTYSPALRAALTTSEARPAALLAVAEPVTGPTTALPPRSASAPTAAAKSPERQPVVSASTERTPAKPPRSTAKPAPKTPVPVLAASTRKPAKVAAEPQARLRLDAPEPVVVAAVAIDLAASQAELLSTMAQLETLGQNLGSVQREQRATEARLLAMRADLEAADRERSKADRGLRMLQAALILAVVALAVACFYLWRSRRQEREQRWWNGADQAAAQPPEKNLPPRETAGPTPGLAPLFNSAESALSAAPAVLRSDEPTMSLPVLNAAPAFEMPAPDLTEPATAVTVTALSGFVDTRPVRSVEPVAFTFTDTPDRHVTVEELIDLEQQVDFFQVLGQVDAAIGLLQERIDTGAASALPYLKLMEIYQQQGLPGQAAFADLAERFGARFGALPPTWGADLNLGRQLDAYGAVLRSVQARWSDSGGSMALLQNLLSHGADDARGFDLPAYRDLLMLYSVARELSEREVRSEDIDLFLPLDELSDDAAAMMATMVWQVQPTLVNPGSVDLDISLDEAPPRA